MLCVLSIYYDNLDIPYYWAEFALEIVSATSIKAFRREGLGEVNIYLDFYFYKM